MNIQLINPFGQNFPERVDQTLDASAQCVRFNNGRTSKFAGGFVAIGRTDGCVGILDLETRTYLQYLEGHVKAVTALCWSRNSRYLLSASRDWNAVIWDLKTGERRDTVRFDAPVLTAQIHPRNSRVILVTLQGYADAVLEDTRDPELGARFDLDVDQLDPDEAENTPAESSKKRRETATNAVFNPSGDLIYVGTSAGSLCVFDTQTKNLLRKEPISPGNAIRHLSFHPKGTALVVNSNDRTLRLYLVDESGFLSAGLTTADRLSSARNCHSPLTPQHRFQDLVNRTPWNSAGFSHDGEFVVAGAGHKAAHQTYIWDRSNGNLVKILEGPKDCLDDFDWHPSRPIAVSSSDQGLLHIWTSKSTERWAAYAPGFEELEENLEYQEKEDEFDIEDPKVAYMRDLAKQDAIIDVLGGERSYGGVRISGQGVRDDAQYVLMMHMASSQEWADLQPDEDDNPAFSLPLDVDLTEYDLDEGARNFQGNGVGLL